MCRASWSSGDLGLDRGSVSRSVHAKRVMRLMPPCHSAIMMHDAHHGCSSSSERSYHVHHQHITALERVSRSRSVTRCDLICAARALRRASFTGDESPGVRGSATFFFFSFQLNGWKEGGVHFILHAPVRWQGYGWVFVLAVRACRDAQRAMTLDRSKKKGWSAERDRRLNFVSSNIGE